MLTRNFRLTLVCLSAALCPAISGAAPGQRSFEACVNAFEKTLATPAAPGRSYRVLYRGDFGTSAILNFYSAEYSFDMQASDAKTGVPLAHVRCDVNKAGVVTAMKRIPLPSGTLAAARRSDEVLADRAD